MHRSMFATLTLLFALSLGQVLPAQRVNILRSGSTELINPRTLGVTVVAGYETGAIPTGVASPCLSYGLLPRLEISGGTTIAMFVDQEEYRATQIHLRLTYELLDDGPLSCSPYVEGAYTPGNAVTVPYDDDLDTVHTVVAEHGDPGSDVTGGVIGAIAPLVSDPAIDLGYSVDYSRTMGRDYYPALEESDYQNRLRLNLFPFTYVSVGEHRCMITVQNRYTYWFDRGNMLDLLPQATLLPNGRFQVTAGISLPLLGGNVYKFLLGTTLETGINYEREIRIPVRDLHFPPDQAILYGPENDMSNRNRRRIRRLYRKLEKYPDYSIVVEGHTSWVYWDDPVRGPQEQQDVLIPLSRARAAAVVDALTELGLSRERMSYVGKGGSEPSVPFDDQDQWKNRRVEVVLVRE